MGPYLVGVDIGGTFTDCVVLDKDGHITATKSPSTPGNFAEGMLGAMAVAALMKLLISLQCWKRRAGSAIMHRLTMLANSAGMFLHASAPAACGVSLVNISWMTTPRA